MESMWESPFSFLFWLLDAAGLLGPLAPSLCMKPANGGVFLKLFHSDKPPVTTAHHLHPRDEGHRSSHCSHLSNLLSSRCVVLIPTCDVR